VGEFYIVVKTQVKETGYTTSLVVMREVGIWTSFF